MERPIITELLCFGFGYSARTLSALLQNQGISIAATCRDRDKYDVLQKQNIRPILITDDKPFREEDLGAADAILLSAPPQQDSDPIYEWAGATLIAHKQQIKWAGYLSTTGVYGNHNGAWVDEKTIGDKMTARGKKRIMAERLWQQTGLPLHIFRLAGIYGPGRNIFRQLQAGTARRIYKPEQVFSRIHVVDIARALFASLNHPQAGAIYNLADDYPAPPQDIVTFAAQLMGITPPPLQDFETADMSEMGRSFYQDNKRVSNQHIKQALGFYFLYPDYRRALSLMWQQQDI